MMNLPEKEFSQLSNEEAKEQLLSILPEDEKTELETYDIFYFDRRGEGNWEISEGNPKVWMLRGKRVVPDIARGQQEHLPCGKIQRFALRRPVDFGLPDDMIWVMI